VSAADIYLSFTSPDVKGESLDKVHNGKIECLSFNWDQMNLGTSGTGGGAGSGGVVKHDLSISKYVDKASNVLAQACAAGTHFKSATLWVRKSGGDNMLDYLQIDLSDNVFISGYNISGTGGDNVVPTEQIHINFTKLMMTYNQQGMTGSGTGPSAIGWDYGSSTKL
jgi:type VI secretion system secreted protein Hcp